MLPRIDVETHCLWVKECRHSITVTPGHIINIGRFNWTIKPTVLSGLWSAAVGFPAARMVDTRRSGAAQWRDMEENVRLTSVIGSTRGEQLITCFLCGRMSVCAAQRDLGQTDSHTCRSLNRLRTQTEAAKWPNFYCFIESGTICPAPETSKTQQNEKNKDIKGKQGHPWIPKAKKRGPQGDAGVPGWERVNETIHNIPRR